MISSPMEPMPPPMEAIQPTKSYAPVLQPMIPFTTVPTTSTVTTFMPESARPMTSIYGISFTHSTGAAAGVASTERPRIT